jgi:NAD(P)-dependent dehydrogenase (short-subunit alcohol dehydrogenase family)
MRLTGKIAFITGASNGIGAAIARLFAKEGADLILADIDERKGIEVANELDKDSQRAVFVKVDIRSSKSVESCVKSALESFNMIHILVNNAGIGGLSTTLDTTSEEDWDKYLEVNLKGLFLCSKYILPVMMKNKGGSIINTASLTSLRGMAKAGPYTAAKGGVYALTRQMAVDYAPYGIRVNSVCPGIVNTRLAWDFFSNEKLRRQIEQRIPLGRFAEPEDIAKAVLFLGSEESGYITGTSIVVDGGYSAL